MSNSAPETGHSTASIRSAINDDAWKRVLPEMQAGGILRRERTGYYYVGGRGGLTLGRVRKLERSGVLIRVGVDSYQLREHAHA